MFRGDISVRRVWVLVTRLLEEPWSRLRRAKLGEKWLGYGRDESRFDDLLDHIKLLISATARNPRAKLKNPVERPEFAAAPTRTIADMGGTLAGLAAQINS